APLVSLASRHVNVATTHAVGTIATRKEEVLAVGRNAVRSFVIEFRIDFSLQQNGFHPLRSAVARAHIEVLPIFGFTGEYDGVLVGRETGKVFIGLTVNGRPHLMNGESRPVGGCLNAKAAIRDVFFRSCLTFLR